MATPPPEAAEERRDVGGLLTKGPVGKRLGGGLTQEQEERQSPCGVHGAGPEDTAVTLSLHLAVQGRVQQDW